VSGRDRELISNFNNGVELVFVPHNAWWTLLDGDDRLGGCIRVIDWVRWQMTHRLALPRATLYRYALGTRDAI
jgi:hypothetical protein